MSKTNKRTPVRKKADAGPPSDDVRPAPTKKKTQRVARKSADESPRPRRGRAVPAKPPIGAAPTETKAPRTTVAIAEPVAPAQPPIVPALPPARRIEPSSSFGAGIFDEEETRAPSQSGHARDESLSHPIAVPLRRMSMEAGPVVDRVTAPAQERRQSESSADPGEAGRRPKEPAGKRSRGFKSRKQRMAEEAEVIATLSRPPQFPVLEAERVSSESSQESSDEHGFSETVVGDSSATEVLILPVDDSPLEPPVAPGLPLADEAGVGRRRRRRRGRRGRGRGLGAPAGADSEKTGADTDESVSEAIEAEEAEVESYRHPPTRVIPSHDEEWPADLGVELEAGEDDESAEAEARSLAMGEEHASESREMLINVAESEECRIAILREGRLDELFIERASASSNVGNIYKGRVTNVEPSIQAAFVDFGLPAHGFLHISDLHPQHFPDGKAETTEQVGKKTPRRQRPPIQSCLKRGQEVIVQVIKEGIGTKGPTLTSYISLPGRFLVMMPGMDQLGVSRKIEDEELRRQMRAMLEELTLPENIGFIVRTAGVDRSRKDLQRDLNFLVRLWRQVEKRIKSEPAPAELYKESDLVIRTIRDVYDSTLRKITVDSSLVAQRIQDFLSIASPRTTDVVDIYEGDEPLFHRHGIEAEIDRLHSKTVPLPSGGSLVIEQTEAMVAVDVNSGRFRVPENAEETAYRVNVEAVDEIARQLRLRDLGGLIVCDLIDMTLERHRRAVEKRLADALRKHKERAKILRISRFGLLEMTRQRQRPSLLKSIFRDCPRCSGSGRVKSSESVALDVMRQIRLASNKEGVARIDARVSTPVANDLLNRKRHHLTDLERTKSQVIQIHGVEAFGMDQVEVVCSDRRGRDVIASATSSPGSDSQNRGSGRFPMRGRRRGRGGRGRPRDSKG